MRKLIVALAAAWAAITLAVPVAHAQYVGGVPAPLLGGQCNNRYDFARRGPGGAVCNYSSLSLNFAAGLYKTTTAYVRTNYVLNSEAPATQTVTLPVGSYTLAVTGAGSATTAAGTATLSGAGTATAGTPNTITVTVAGTVTVTVSGSLTRFQLQNGHTPNSYIPTTTLVASTATYQSVNPADVGDLSFTNASGGYAQFSNGTLQWFPANTTRCTDQGCLIEQASTNYFLNSFAPVTQTVTLSGTGNFTTSVWGQGTATTSAGTATCTGYGTATVASANTINCTVTGTIGVTVAGSPVAVQVEPLAFKTSPIPTTSASATRSADVMSYANAAPASGSAYTMLAAVNDNGIVAPSGTRALADLGSSRGQIVLNTSNYALGINGVGSLSNVANPGGSSCLAGSFQPSAQGFSVNGGSVASTANATADGSGLIVYVGQNASGNYFNGYVRKLAFTPYFAAANENQYRSACNF